MGNNQGVERKMLVLSFSCTCYTTWNEQVPLGHIKKEKVRDIFNEYYCDVNFKRCCPNCGKYNDFVETDQLVNRVVIMWEDEYECLSCDKDIIVTFRRVGRKLRKGDMNTCPDPKCKGKLQKVTLGGDFLI